MDESIRRSKRDVTNPVPFRFDRASIPYAEHVRKLSKRLVRFYFFFCSRKGERGKRKKGHESLGSDGMLIDYAWLGFRIGCHVFFAKGKRSEMDGKGTAPHRKATETRLTDRMSCACDLHFHQLGDGILLDVDVLYHRDERYPVFIHRNE